jgi:hypothetical protein
MTDVGAPRKVSSLRSKNRVIWRSGDPMIGFIPNSLDKFRAARKSLRRNSVLLMVRVFF